ncbi:Hypothetical predicted protein [Prunus dulcis]|uniref:Uncharacterized protein n=1 Tax=Prunus dulcis TaxID=3755 RepID=A0A5E4FYS2_PRUDU|nr:Hypothetical predicted protein [Prunus dulcis]
MVLHFRKLITTFSTKAPHHWKPSPTRPAPSALSLNPSSTPRAAHAPPFRKCAGPCGLLR